VFNEITRRTVEDRMMTMATGSARVAAGGGEVIRIGGFVTVVKVAEQLPSGSASVVEHTLAPGLLGAPPHRHAREDETSYVLEGTLSAQVGEEVVTVGAGEILVKPRGIFHTFWNAGAEPVRFVEVISPGGFERYFAELARIIPPDGPPDMGELVALAARYGMEFDLARIPELLERHRLRLG
jgi:quercetin dioxygenase-like cupin family protein